MKQVIVTIAVSVMTLVLAAPAGAWYDPSAGRFLTRDPFGTAPSLVTVDSISPMAQYSDGASLYQYVRSSPLRFTDPTGLYCKDQCRAGDVKGLNVSAWAMGPNSLSDEPLFMTIDSANKRLALLSRVRELGGLGGAALRLMTERAKRAATDALMTELRANMNGLGPELLRAVRHLGEHEMRRRGARLYVWVEGQGCKRGWCGFCRRRWEWEEEPRGYWYSCMNLPEAAWPENNRSAGGIERHVVDPTDTKKIAVALAKCIVDALQDFDCSTSRKEFPEVPEDGLHSGKIKR